METAVVHKDVNGTGIDSRNRNSKIIRNRNKKKSGTGIGNSLWQKILCLWKQEEGAFTMEACFLVVILSFLVCGIMMIGLYFCDLNQTKSYLNQRVTQLSVNGKAYENLTEDRSTLKKRLFVANLVSFSIEKTGSKVKGEASLEMKPGVPLVGDWIGRIWNHSFCLEVDIGDNIKQIWRFENSD